MATFLPGKTLVPRWRIKMEPTWAMSPGVTFRPKYFGLESRPFLVVPADFLCAINVYIYPELVEGYTKSHMNISEEVSFDKNGHVERFSGGLRKFSLAIIIILVASFSFGIGRLSVVGKREPIKIEYDPDISSPAPVSTLETNKTASVINAIKTSSPVVSNSTVVVSKNGTKYHYLHCPGAKQIKEENKITFASPAAAEAAGYTLAGNCKPR